MICFYSNTIETTTLSSDRHSALMNIIDELSCCQSRGNGKFGVKFEKKTFLEQRFQNELIAVVPLFVLSVQHAFGSLTWDSLFSFLAITSRH